MSNTSAYILLALAGIIAVLQIIPYDIEIEIAINKKEDKDNGKK